MDTSSPLDWLSPEEINTPLRRMEGPDARQCGEWTADKFKIGQGGGLGTWRVAGEMETARGRGKWSMVLKGWTCSDRSGSPTAFNWPWREAELYSSGVLEELPAIAAPACFHSVEREDSVWVWLEDLTGVPQDRWTLERYAEAAHLLGQFNAAYLDDHPMPVHRCLSQQWLAGWSAEGAAGLRMLDQYRDHPVVQRIIPPDVEAALNHTWNRRPVVLDRLTALPHTFCHLDAFHANTFFRETGNASELVLIDWSFAGRAAIGEELVALCMAGFIFDPFTPYSFEEIEQVAFDGYITGLKESGWTGEEETVWDTYRAGAHLRYGTGALSIMLPIMTNETATAAFAQALGASVADARDHLARIYRWIADHADEV